MGLEVHEIEESKKTEGNMSNCFGNSFTATLKNSFIIKLFKMFTYDLVLWFFNLVVHTFFRDIKSSGTYNLPRQGPVIFVIAPHANQFVDGLIVMAKVMEHSGRRISFLIAGKSYRRLFVGNLSKLTSPIPVERAQDLLKTATGKIKIEDLKNDPLTVIGEGTKFTKECMVRGLIGLPFGSCPIESIDSDTRLTLKKPFKVNLDNPSSRDDEIINALTNGISFKTAPHIDNNIVFQNVFKHLNSGNVVGIFPEGGSHDRSDLLPLKPGVAIMALGAAAQSVDPNIEIKVIPVGLNYFHPHKFRSRVVIEFGEPIIVDKKLGEKYKANTREEVNRLLQVITMGLKKVTVTCNDYDTLMIVQTARRLYTASSRREIPTPVVVEMNRRLIKGYEKFSDDPEVKELRQLVTEYNKQLMRLGLRDHQVPRLTSSNRAKTLFMFMERLFKVLLFCGLALPGVFLFSPVFITAKRISRKKASEALKASEVKLTGRDVLSTWKIIVALILAPALYIFYSVLGTILISKMNILPENFSTVALFLICYGWSVLTTYASLRVGEIGVDYYKSLRPLFYSVISDEKDILQIEELKKKREYLAQRVSEFCNKVGPDLFEDYDRFYKNNLQRANENDYETDNESYEYVSPMSRTSSFNLDNLGDIPIFSSILDLASPTSKAEDEPAKEVETKAQVNSQSEKIANFTTSANLLSDSDLRRRK